MTTSAIRKKLINYINEADEKKLKGMYLLLEEEIEKGKALHLTEEHLAILDEERAAYLAGTNKAESWTKAKQIIRGKK